MRAIGNRIYQIPADYTFHDIVLDTPWYIVGEEWFQRELGKPEAACHQLARWFNALQAWERELSKLGSGSKGYRARPIPGEVQAFRMFAYDVYCLASVPIPPALLERVRDREGFQGALYELAVAALFARAGCEIEFLDENIATRHCEFIATHPTTGDRIGVEAKSRHRPGVIHRPGVANVSKQRGDIRRLLLKASKQAPVDLPYIVFIDVNLPPTPGLPVSEKPWWPGVKAVIDAYVTPRGPLNAVAVTNWAYHYLGRDGAPGASESVCVVSTDPKNRLRKTDLMTAIVEEVRRRGDVPLDLHDIARIAHQETRGTKGFARTLCDRLLFLVRAAIARLFRSTRKPPSNARIAECFSGSGRRVQLDPLLEIGKKTTSAKTNVRQM